MTPDEVAMLMQDLLDSDDVAVDDSFFEAGGNSIAALTLISRIAQRTGTSLSLIEVLRHPTPDGISQLLTAR